jgi:phytoene/squalene synthetase
LRRIGVAAPPAEPADDQTYSEAAIDNALHDSGRAIDALSAVVALGRRTDERLRASIERLKLSAADPIEVIARISRRHPQS